MRASRVPPASHRRTRETGRAEGARTEPQNFCVRLLIRAARPDGAPIYIILDNLSAHTGADIRRWAKRNKAEFCFTPAYAS